MMNRHQLINFIKSPGSLDSSNISLLEHFVRLYPYSQTLRLLLLKNLHKENNYHYDEALKLTAAYATDRSKLYVLIHQEDKYINSVERIIEKYKKPSTVTNVKESSDALVDKTPISVKEEIIKSEITVDDSKNIKENTEVPVKKGDEVVEDSKLKEEKTSDITAEEKTEIANEKVEHHETPISVKEEITKSEIIVDDSKDINENTEGLLKKDDEVVEYHKFVEEKTTVITETIVEKQITSDDVSEKEEISAKHEDEKEKEKKESLLKQVQDRLDEINKEESIKKEETADIKEVQEKKEEVSEIKKEIFHNEEDVSTETVDITESKNNIAAAKEVLASRESKNKDDLIDLFIKNEPQLGPARSNFSQSIAIVELGIIDKEDIVTETLAKIYNDQGFHKKAIKIYEKLSLTFPEKSIYFAAQIEKVKKEQLEN